MRGTRLAAAFAARTDLKAVLADPQSQRCVEDQQLAWRQIIAQGVLIGVPLPSECRASIASWQDCRTQRVVAFLLLAKSITCCSNLRVIALLRYNQKRTDGAWNDAGLTARTDWLRQEQFQRMTSPA